MHPDRGDLLTHVDARGTGHIVLNRPRALNALTLPMAEAFLHTLDDWTQDASVRLVLVRGAGDRGLCAGGDIRLITEAAKAGTTLPERFFRAEYRLNARIARYPKPILAIMDGIVMGGGIGVSAHARHRVVTERSTLAMPETAIGFITDIGGTYLLSRAPGELGTHLGLTGARMSGADAIHCGFADLFVAAARIDELCAAPGQFHEFAETPPRSALALQRGWIDRCYRADSVEEILAALDASDEPEAHDAAATLRRMSPTSLKVTLRALREARGLGRLEPCLEQEFRIATAMARPGSDFVEGVRAVIVDKDRTPRWQPATLDAVTEEIVARHFVGRSGIKLDLPGAS